MKDSADLNKKWIGFHLGEANEELERIASKLGNKDFDEVDLRIGMQHLYHHLNTAWNSRHSSQAETGAGNQTHFDNWRQYPKDLDDSEGAV